MADQSELEDLLSQPTEALVQSIREVESPLVILGAGGKMGPTLALMASKAADAARHSLRVVAVSRFTDPQARQWLEARRVETLPCDLLNRDEVAALPESSHVVYMAGLKFGTGKNPALTWAANTIIPTNVCERYPAARIVALSTGNVYPLVAPESGGAREDSELTPLGEYPNAAVARERLFEYHSARNATRLALIRLSYAVELRYGVIRDIAQAVWENRPVPLATGYLNCIWQADANDAVLRALGHAASPPLHLNLTGCEQLSVQAVARRLGELMEREVTFEGKEAETALLSNTSAACSILGAPATPISQVIEWTADWVKRGQASLNKPTHFEVRDGRY